MHRRALTLMFFVLASCVAGRTAVAAEVALVEEGKARCAIYAPPRVMAADVELAPDAPSTASETEKQRRRLRGSVEDLALYLGRMSGATVEIRQREPQPGDEGVPILIAEYATAKFGDAKQKTRFHQGWRMTLTPAAVGLQGESDEAASYAVFEILDRLGCRWFMPGELGEVIPHLPTVRLPEGDTASVPSTASRLIWYADDAFMRRNRLGGFAIKANHALEHYITLEQRQQHPDWRATINGQPHPTRLKWSKPEVAHAIADAIIAQLDRAYVPTVSISPDDGFLLDQTDDAALDAGDWDPAMGQVSSTDRLIVLANRIAERVTAKHPDVLIGFLAYVQYTRPPVREKLHKNLVPQIAPIQYCRTHAMTDPSCPSRATVKPIVEGWAKAAEQVSYYNYMYHLAEVSAPYPMIRQMSDELPILYANKVVFWQPETITNFEAVLPGMWLSIRMAWDKDLAPAPVLDEFFRTFYGSAAEPMRRYWQTIDDAWNNVPAHAGGQWSYPRRFTPDVMAKARAAMDEALAAARSPAEFKRVTFHERSLRQFDRFMRMRHDLNDGRIAKLDRQGLEWLGTHIGLGEEYAANYAFTKIDWFGADYYTQAGLYFRWFIQSTNDDAARIARDFHVMKEPVRNWRYAFQKKPAGKTIQSPWTPDDVREGESNGWSKRDFDDSAWKTTDVGVDTWSDLGLDNEFGTVWYRRTVLGPAIPPGKKLYLWIPATDGAVKLFVNGKHVPYRDAKGAASDVAYGYAQPFSFDVTDALKVSDHNQITIAGTRLDMNELGTGGLMGPVYIYFEK